MKTPQFALCVAFAACWGCGQSGPDLYDVQGRVVKGGQPLTNVLVTFTPEDTSQPSSVGSVDANGHFTLSTSSGEEGAVVGKHKVILTAVQPSATTAQPNTPEFFEQMAQQRGGGEAAGGGPGARSSAPPPAPELPFPEEYASGDTTPLTFEVTADESKNDFTIEIPAS